MKRFLFFLGISIIALLRAVHAQGYDSILPRVAPTGVAFGLTEEELKSQRPKAYPGPAPSISKNSNLPNEFSTFMEITGLGHADSVSYWYLLEGGRLVGVLRSKNLIGNKPESYTEEAQKLFREFVQKLGEPSQQKIIRKGDHAFVVVRADVWENISTGEKVSFIATDREITIGIFARSGFPLNQILIRPDAQRFPMEDDANSSIKDFARPAIAGLNAEAATIVKQAIPAAPIINTVPAANEATERINEEPAKPAVTDEAKRTNRGLIFMIVSGLAAMVCLIGWIKLRGRR